jgi:MYND finger
MSGDPDRAMFELQVSEFRKRIDPMRAKLKEMWHRDNFKEASAELWHEVLSGAQKRHLYNECMKRVDGSLPPPYQKAKALLDMSCPELDYSAIERGGAEKEQKVSGEGIITLVDAVARNVENSPADYGYAKFALQNVNAFIKSVDGNVYPQFREHPKRLSFTVQLLVEQRSMWIVNFALNAVAEFCGCFSSLPDQADEHGVDVDVNANDVGAASSSSFDQDAVAEQSSGGASGGAADDEEEQEEATTDDDAPQCLACQRRSVDLSRCSACKLVYFCDRNCQRQVWKQHRLDCKK